LHAGALKVARSVPSIVILHDIMLAGLFVNAIPPPELREILTRYYGPERADEAMATVGHGTSIWDGDDALQMPLFEAALEHAVGVIVHSEFAADLVRATTIAPVGVIPLAFGDARDQSVVDIDVPFPTFVLTLGQANENKCHEVVIDALRQLKVHDTAYIIAGAITARRRATLMQRAEDAGVGERVIITGQITDAEVRGLLRRATVCVTLRRPTFESGSASLLEQLQARRPVVVLDHGCYSDVPDDAVVKVSVDVDADGLAVVLNSLLMDEQQRGDIGRRAAAYVAAEHTIEEYARRLVEFFDTVDGSTPCTDLAVCVAAWSRRWNTPSGSQLPSRWAAEVSTMLGVRMTEAVET